MEMNSELVAELREKFFKKLEEEGAPDPGFHSADIERIKKNDDWLCRFLEHHDCKIAEAFKMLWDVCIWRSKVGANEMTEDNVKREYLEDGVVFSRGKDKDGKKLFIVKSKLHTKGSREFSELQRCIIYWFERLERETNGDQISIFFDMSESGLSNVDMEFTQYLIGLFKNYYPNFLNYIIIFEMSWVLNAAFKIIKSWLPAKAIPKIKFVNKNTLKEFVEPDQALKCWGGNDDYTFVFVPEMKSNSENMTNGKLDNKKVHFAENSPIMEQPPNGFNSRQSDEQLLSIEPEEIVFKTNGKDVTGTITLKNISQNKPVSYKIKTTSPDKFRVKPSSGILSPEEQLTVTVVLQTGTSGRSILYNARFLVMCLPLKSSDTTPNELTTLWKTEKPIEQHRLTCVDGMIDSLDSCKSYPSGSSGSAPNNSLETVLMKIMNLEEQNNKLSQKITSLKHLIILLVMLTILFLIAVGYILRNQIFEHKSCHYYDM